MAVSPHAPCLPHLLLKAFCWAPLMMLAATAVGQDGNLPNQWAMVNANVELDANSSRQTVRMVINTSREITSDRPFKRIRIQNPSVVKAIPLEGDRLQISALSTGITQVDLLSADGATHAVEVMVLGDVRELEAVLRELFPDGNLSVMPVQQGCIVSGYVTSDEHVDEVISIAELYFPTVINKVTVTGVHTVQLEVQIMEVSRTKLRELGVDWAFNGDNGFVRQAVGGLIDPITGLTTGSENFVIGVIDDTSSFLASVKALRRNNLVKVLATPTLTAVDGRPASFNAGGEIPIIVPAGLGQVAIQFREFGTRLDYVAKVRGNGKIWLEVRPYVSEVDPTRSVILEGIQVPGLRSRFLETGVELGVGQTLALGGLLQLRSESINTGLPVLSEMPYLGTLFRTTREEQNEIELLITVTPNFAGPMDPHEVPRVAPGLNSDSPSDTDLYMRGYIEVPVVNGAGAENCEPGSQHGLIETVPAGQPLPEPAAAATPTPNPAAMSVGPNAPRLATQPASASVGPSTEAEPEKKSFGFTGGLFR